MPTLTIKGMPPELYRRLKQQAEAHRRSLNGEIIVCLERIVGAGPIDAEAWLREAAELRARLAIAPLDPGELQTAKAAGRA